MSSSLTNRGGHCHLRTFGQQQQQSTCMKLIDRTSSNDMRMMNERALCTCHTCVCTCMCVCHAWPVHVLHGSMTEHDPPADKGNVMMVMRMPQMHLHAVIVTSFIVCLHVVDTSSRINLHM